MEGDNKIVKQLEGIAQDCRKQILKMIYSAQSGHPGGSMSAVEILTSLYFNIMDYDPANPERQERDRFVCSKGHAAPALYAVLNWAGFFNDDAFLTFRQAGGMLQGHPDIKIPGVDMSTGSLGIGLSAACGMALGLKLKGLKNKVYCLIGDGEQNEGIIWEAALAAAHHKLNNLIVFVDRNMSQNDGTTDEILQLSPIEDKWKSFNWNVEVIDGHNFADIITAVENVEKEMTHPSIFIAHTIKGKGTSYSESTHYHPPTEQQFKEALAELGEN